jgi:hypothetical protein
MVYAAEIEKLYELLQMSGENAILDALVKKFYTNSCFSEFRAFLGYHQISYKGFVW